MSKTKMDNVTKGLVTLTVLIIAFITYRHFSVKNKFEDKKIEKTMTTGVIVKFDAAGRSASSFVYKFEVSGKKYENRHIIVSKIRHNSHEELKEYIGKKYQVWYVIDDPSYNKLLIEKPIIEKIQQ